MALKRQRNLQIRTTDDEYEIYKAVAELEGMSLSNWVRLALNDRMMKAFDRRDRGELMSPDMMMTRARRPMDDDDD